MEPGWIEMITVALAGIDDHLLHQEIWEENSMGGNCRVYMTWERRPSGLFLILAFPSNIIMSIPAHFYRRENTQTLSVAMESMSIVNLFISDWIRSGSSQSTKTHLSACTTRLCFWYPRWSDIGSCNLCFVCCFLCPDTAQMRWNLITGNSRCHAGYLLDFKIQTSCKFRFL